MFFYLNKIFRTLLLHHSAMQYQQNKWPHGVVVMSFNCSKQRGHFNLDPLADCPGICIFLVPSKLPLYDVFARKDFYNIIKSANCN